MQTRLTAPTSPLRQWWSGHPYFLWPLPKHRRQMQASTRRQLLSTLAQTMAPAPGTLARSL
ncbi:hypothetical protein BDW74DRAFT_164103 [Aspergillus multicolor]|uniref:uncharacterized protein n=1 Tax=Aspergillus multicolor TaxID=41759 RepID=UPI003CCCCE30